MAYFNSRPGQPSRSNCPNVQELKVFVSKSSKKKKHQVMKFNESMNVDFTKWKKATLRRENNKHIFEPETEESPESEFGSVKRRRFRSAREAYNPNEQPWILESYDETCKEYRSQIEGGFSDNAAYYVLSQRDDGLEAHPIEEWYTFQRNKKQLYTFTSEEVEEQFSKRNKYTNYFSLVERMKSNQITEEEEARKKKSKDGGSSDESSDEECDRIRNRKEKQTAKRKKSSLDDEACEESDDGDGEGRECDYLTSDSDSEKEEFSIRGVAEEKAIRQILDSDEEESEEDIFQDLSSAQGGNKVAPGSNSNSSSIEQKMTAKFDSKTVREERKQKKLSSKVKKAVSDVKKGKLTDGLKQKNKKFKK